MCSSEAWAQHIHESLRYWQKVPLLKQIPAVVSWGALTAACEASAAGVLPCAPACNVCVCVCVCLRAHTLGQQ